MLNCVTDLGTPIPLGTLHFPEAGLNYTCRDSALHTPALLEQDGGRVRWAEECEEGRAEYVREGFVMSCARTATILGCADVFGDLVKQGLFLADRRALRFCYVYKGGRRAKVERIGECGTRCGGCCSPFCIKCGCTVCGSCQNESNFCHITKMPF